MAIFSTEVIPTRTVLIVDSDLAFVFWLGQALDKAGYQAFPAKSIPDASTLLLEANLHIDLLIVGPSTLGAAAFAAALRRSQGHLKLIGLIGNGEDPAATLPGTDASRRKPLLVDGASIREWLETIQGIFRQSYYYPTILPAAGGKPS